MLEYHHFTVRYLCFKMLQPSAARGLVLEAVFLNFDGQRNWFLRIDSSEEIDSTVESTHAKESISTPPLFLPELGRTRALKIYILWAIGDFSPNSVPHQCHEQCFGSILMSIRIWIWIQHFRSIQIRTWILDPDPDSGPRLSLPKWYNKTFQHIFYFFFSSQTAINPWVRTPRLKWKPSDFH